MFTNTTPTLTFLKKLRLFGGSKLPTTTRTIKTSRLGWCTGHRWEMEFARTAKWAFHQEPKKNTGTQPKKKHPTKKSVQLL